MKLLLTSGGLENQSIINALSDLVQKPFSELNVAFIPTAANVEEDKSYVEKDFNSLKLLNIKNIIKLDISSVKYGVIEKNIINSDIIWFTGGNTFYLLQQLRKSGLDKKLILLLKGKVFVGVSAGSIVATPNISTANIEPADTNCVKIKNLDGLNFVDFEISPHTNSCIPLENVQNYSKNLNNTVYALDDNSAIKIDGDKIEVVSEGSWKKFE